MRTSISQLSRVKAKAASRQTDSFRHFFVAASAFLIAILLAFPVFSQTTEVPAATTGATQSVVRDQLEAFRAGDHVRAYSYAAPNIKNYFTTLEHFMAMVRRGYQPIYEPESFVMGRNRAYNDDIYQEVLITDKFGKEWQAVYTLKQQKDGSWKITGVKLEPFKGASV